MLRERNECTRKLRHPDFLSALRHAVGLNDAGLSIYGCCWCGWLHVGHHLRRNRRRETKLKESSVKKRKLVVATLPFSPLERAVLKTQARVARKVQQHNARATTTREERHRFNQSMRDLHAHLRVLKKRQKRSRPNSYEEDPQLPPAGLVQSRQAKIAR